jgi:hypothetical protein
MGAQGIENMLIIFIIYDYGGEKKKALQRHEYKKTLIFHSEYF